MDAMHVIHEIAAKLGLAPHDLELYGSEIAKVKPLDGERLPTASPGRIVLLSALTPTPAGEGKTTTGIGLAQGLARLGESVCVALREPSLGPCFGVKGGGTGGGQCQLLPADRINLHFTGDFHAVAAAHNLLAALIDNHLHFGNPLRIDPRRVAWRRVLDINDRALREIVTGLGERSNGVPRQTGFDITAASELMAILCLAEDVNDLRTRIDRTLVAHTGDGEPVTSRDLSATGAILALLREALLPNLVRTTEGVPAFVHGGPFANIAHGCSSVIATKTALRLADWVVTEAGFGFELGAEKFFHIKCRSAGIDAAAVVLVATCRALKFHGGSQPRSLAEPDPAAVESGLANLDKQVENARCFGKVPLVALNRFPGDHADEIQIVRRRCEALGVPFAETDHFARGGTGALDLAHALLALVKQETSTARPLYALTDSVPDKIRAVATKMYGARQVRFTKTALRDLQEIERLGYGSLPICIAKTPSSLSDDSRSRGPQTAFDITVQQIQINSGAGFLVVLTGDILRMPGLPREPLAQSIDLVKEGIVGLQ